MPDTAKAITEIYEDQRSPTEVPRGNDPGENGAQRPLNIVSPKSEKDAFSDSSTEEASKGK